MVVATIWTLHTNQNYICKITAITTVDMDPVLKNVHILVGFCQSEGDGLKAMVI